MTAGIAPAAPRRDGVALIVHRSTLDIAMMPMIMAQGALSTGTEVSLHRTSLGPGPLRRDPRPRMPGMWRPLTGMMARGTGRRGIPTFSQMLTDVLERGAKVYACSTSMTMMGARKQDPVDGVEIAGVARSLDMAASAGTALAIG